MCMSKHERRPKAVTGTKEPKQEAQVQLIRNPAYFSQNFQETQPNLNIKASKTAKAVTGTKEPKKEANVLLIRNPA